MWGFGDPKYCFHLKRMLFKNLLNEKYSRLNTTTSSVHSHSSKGTLRRKNPIFRFMQINVDITYFDSDRRSRCGILCLCVVCMCVQLRFSRNLKKLTNIKLTTYNYNFKFKHSFRSLWGLQAILQLSLSSLHSF